MKWCIFLQDTLVCRFGAIVQDECMLMLRCFQHRCNVTFLQNVTALSILVKSKINETVLFVYCPENDCKALLSITVTRSTFYLAPQAALWNYDRWEDHGCRLLWMWHTYSDDTISGKNGYDTSIVAVDSSVLHRIILFECCEWAYRNWFGM